MPLRGGFLWPCEIVKMAEVWRESDNPTICKLCEKLLNFIKWNGFEVVQTGNII
jgi:hypothetical protein